MDTIEVGLFFKENETRLRLELVTTREGLRRKITQKHLHRPGLALAGFLELFTFDRIQILGNTEMTYLRNLSEEERRAKYQKVFSHNIPCMIVTDSNPIPQVFIDEANDKKLAVFSTSHSTTVFIHLLSDYLDDKFAPKLTMHGSLVDVYGTGLLLTGRSGIGKSEIALDLVERGHRLVADDVVIITKKAEGILIGSGPEMLKHFMEIRGVGIIDVWQVFGVRAIRLQKRVEVQVELVDWDSQENYERVGLDEEFKDFHGVKIPYLQLPIFPGKNITVIAEVIALNLHLKVYGYHPARAFNRRLIGALTNKKRVSSYLDKDYE
ncbi:HPr kinase/phosphorylase [candidate division LCP-89 bacterium B3_LCP]|uniref:HPr kinase/phosphorylase n=1 Tax=candidate division LCP-89 bacterium B3_LCP TaxID=2012998 RepID=A0A532V327_UNCL8|nr:MAG: HPr kinase/phosphorylase [candidate division LCP-89 bacterium B3_LCP]